MRRVPVVVRERDNVSQEIPNFVVNRGACRQEVLPLRWHTTHYKRGKLKEKVYGNRRNNYYCRFNLLKSFCSPHNDDRQFTFAI